MDAILVIELQPWQKESNGEWMRYGTWNIVFSKNKKFTTNDYAKIKDDIFSKSILYGRMWEMNDPDEELLHFGFSIDVNRHQYVSVKKYMFSAEYPLKWKSHYLANFNELLGRIRSSFEINKVLKIEQDC